MTITTTVVKPATLARSGCRNWYSEEATLSAIKQNMHLKYVQSHAPLCVCGCACGCVCARVSVCVCVYARARVCV